MRTAAFARFLRTQACASWCGRGASPPFSCRRRLSTTTRSSGYGLVTSNPSAGTPGQRQARGARGREWRVRPPHFEGGGGAPSTLAAQTARRTCTGPRSVTCPCLSRCFFPALALNALRRRGGGDGALQRRRCVCTAPSFCVESVRAQKSLILVPFSLVGSSFCGGRSGERSQNIERTQRPKGAKKQKKNQRRAALSQRSAKRQSLQK